MAQREPDFQKRELRLPDGRRLIYYQFPDEASTADEREHGARAPSPGDVPDPEER